MKCLFKRIYSIEGNIGAGKSTLIDLIAQNIPGVTILPEPVLAWKNISGEDLLSAFYNDPKRWTFTFELYSMFSKVKRLKNLLQSEANVIVMERSLFSDKAFQHISYYYDKLDTKEMTILQEVYDFLMTDYIGLDGVIYVATSPEICLKRIKKRAREEESGITLDYLKKLDDQFINTNYGCKVVAINGNYDLEHPNNVMANIHNFLMNKGTFDSRDDKENAALNSPNP